MDININFAFFLTWIVIVFFILYVIDTIVWLPKRRALRWDQERDGLPVVLDYVRSLFPVLLLVWVFRSFFFQPYIVPSGSLKPTVMPGDFLVVKQYAYGVKLPVWHTQIMRWNTPKTGQIALVRWPVNPKMQFVKRVIAEPGDDVSYINKVLYINGKKMEQHYVGQAVDSDVGQPSSWTVDVYDENLKGVKHKIYVNPKVPAENFYHLKIPQGKYLLMGDNRDNSDDGRDWGLVSEKMFIGQATYIWMSWSPTKHWFNWPRIGHHL